jgi:hypothetical protein
MRRSIPSQRTRNSRFFAFLVAPAASENNASENGLGPVALSRKIWLCFDSDRGGQAAATLMRSTAWCKACGVEPFAYLRDLLERVSTHPDSRIAERLPDRWKSG